MSRVEQPLQTVRPAQSEPLRRRAPQRKHLLSWVATDQTQLQRSELLLLHGLTYHQATIAGLNTISTDDISAFADDAPAASVPADGSGAEHGGTENKPQADETKDFAESPVLASRAGAVASVKEVEGGRDENGGHTASTPLTGEESGPTMTSVSSHEQKGVEQADRDILVLLHGFAGGVAMWAQNWSFFAARYRVYAVDLPGFARSERRHTTATNVAESMDFICHYLLRWFERLSFGKPVILLGHSFGAFVSAHVAMRGGPSLVRAVVMAEPWGINRPRPERLKSMPLGVRLFMKVFYAANPLALLRGLGPMGPYAVRRTRSDFTNRWKNYLSDPNILYDYIYHCNAASPATGEELFKACCHYDVASKEPLVEVLPGSLDRSISLGLLFGQESWFDPTEALEMGSTMTANGFIVGTDKVPGASHQVFTDNVDGFNTLTDRLIQTLLQCTSTLATSPSTTDAGSADSRAV